MVLLIDANIVIDVLNNREDYVENSSLIWKLCETRQCAGYISALTFANLVYILRKELSPQKIKVVLQTLLLVFQIADLTASDLAKAAFLEWKDFEDALQSVTAEKIHADYIITRNLKDFSRSDVPALTPADFLDKYHTKHK